MINLSVFPRLVSTGILASGTIVAGRKDKDIQELSVLLSGRCNSAVSAACLCVQAVSSRGHSFSPRESGSAKPVSTFSESVSRPDKRVPLLTVPEGSGREPRYPPRTCAGKFVRVCYSRLIALSRSRGSVMHRQTKQGEYCGAGRGVLRLSLNRPNTQPKKVRSQP